MEDDEKARRLDRLGVALWHAGLKPEHRQTAVEAADLSTPTAAEAVDALRELHPEWFGTPRRTAHDAISSHTDLEVDYLTASREDRDRQLWHRAGIQ